MPTPCSENAGTQQWRASAFSLIMMSWYMDLTTQPEPRLVWQLCLRQQRLGRPEWHQVDGWGLPYSRRVRRMARKTLPKHSQVDDLWYLRPSKQTLTSEEEQQIDADAETQ